MITQRHRNKYTTNIFKDEDTWYEEEISKDCIRTRVYTCYVYEAPGIRLRHWTCTRITGEYQR